MYDAPSSVMSASAEEAECGVAAAFSRRQMLRTASVWLVLRGQPHRQCKRGMVVA